MIQYLEQREMHRLCRCSSPATFLGNGLGFSKLGMKIKVHVGEEHQHGRGGCPP